MATVDVVTLWRRLTVVRTGRVTPDFAAEMTGAWGRETTDGPWGGVVLTAVVSGVVTAVVTTGARAGATTGVTVAGGTVAPVVSIETTGRTEDGRWDAVTKPPTPKSTSTATPAGKRSRGVVMAARYRSNGRDGAFFRESLFGAKGATRSVRRKHPDR